MPRFLEFYAKIINVYPAGTDDMIIVFQAGKEWILRGFCKNTSLQKIESMIGKPIKITFEMKPGRELVKVQKIEVMQPDDG